MLKLILLSAIALLPVYEAQLQLWQNYPRYKNGGKKVDFSGSKNLDAWWNNRVSYAIAKKGNYILYDGAGFTGKSLIVLEGDKVSMFKDWNE